ncbi:MAG: translation initiation factor IF-2 [Microscillaceae bacterium]|nr:translation initiation factor IF-2 [Microscillaceae bacterium]
MIRLSQAARELNVGISTLTDTLAAKGHEVENKANAKITIQQLEMLAGEFGVSLSDLKIGSSLNINTKYAEKMDTEVALEEPPVITPLPEKTEEKLITPSIEETIPATIEIPKTNEIKNPEKFSDTKLPGLKVINKIDLDSPKKNKEKPNSDSQNISTQNETTLTTQTTPKVTSQVIPDLENIQKNTPDTVKDKPIVTDHTIKKQIEENSVSSQQPNLPEEIPAENPTSTQSQDIYETKDKILPSIDLIEDTHIQPIKVEVITPEITSSTPKNEEKSAEIKNPVKDKKTVDLNSLRAKIEGNKESKKDRADQDKKTKTTPTQKVEVELESDLEENTQKPNELIKAKAETLKGLTILDKIELPADRRKANRPVASSDDKAKKKRKRKKKRVRRDDESETPQVKAQIKPKTDNPAKSSVKPQTNKTTENSGSAVKTQPANTDNAPKKVLKDNRDKPKTVNKGVVAKKAPTEITDSEIQNQIKATLAKLSNKGKGRRNVKYHKNKDRDQRAEQESESTNILKVTEFISANDLANLMGVSVNQVIATCLSLGMFVSINQRLDAEAITFIADEFNFEVEFISTVDDDKILEEELDAEENLTPRAPIVTIMGHVDHGKTSLLDYIRNTNVTASESGGITQHIGAYDVTTEDGGRIAFLDTPGHEAFTAMRARGAKVTDIVILVIAADDSVMPQTKEAINHAKGADVPIVIAINKVDKPSANPDKIREELSMENILVESWGGKYQDQEISAKTGMGIADLLEKVLLEAELLELKANPNRKAIGTVIEASLDKGKGYVANVLVQNGTLKVGDIVLAGSHYGRVKAMSDHRGNRIKKAGPSTPVQVLGLDGAPQAGDVVRVMDNEREAREIANRREQILREQNIRATKGLTLEEIGRRRLIGDFKELKIIVKGDVDGSVEALSDSLLKLSTPEIDVKIIHKGVGQISEADIMLASASEAIIIGFQVRPSPNAKKAAENEKVQIKLYSVIYSAIEEIKDAMEGMLAPKFEEVIVGNLEIREVFKISKVGTVAGCYVTDGIIKRQNDIRLIRDGIVVYEGQIGALRRFKEEVYEVKSGFECGLSIKGFNDIRVGDVVESYEQREIKRTLT